MQNEASTLANGNKQMKESIQFMIQHQEMQKGMFSLINFTYSVYALYFIISVSFSVFFKKKLIVLILMINLIYLFGYKYFTSKFVPKE
jgi:hypothetical protein